MAARWDRPPSADEQRAIAGVVQADLSATARASGTPSAATMEPDTLAFGSFRRALRPRPKFGNPVLVYDPWPRADTPFAGTELQEDLWIAPLLRAGQTIGAVEVGLARGTERYAARRLHGAELGHALATLPDDAQVLRTDGEGEWFRLEAGELRPLTATAAAPGRPRSIADLEARWIAARRALLRGPSGWLIVARAHGHALVRACLRGLGALLLLACLLLLAAVRRRRGLGRVADPADGG